MQRGSRGGMPRRLRWSEAEGAARLEQFAQLVLVSIVQTLLALLCLKLIQTLHQQLFLQLGHCVMQFLGPHRLITRQGLRGQLVQRFLFLAAFMLSEPLTLPPRRWQQLVVAVVVGLLAGWPVPLGPITLGQERALLIGNLVAFAFCLRASGRLTLESRNDPAPTVRELTFRASRPLTFRAGQYLELEVPHRRPDIRGTRREFSILSAPEDLPTVRVAYRDNGGPQSSFKRALAAAAPGDRLAITGVWGDFVLPADPARPVLLVAAGIGVTPFVSQLRHLAATGDRRDVVLVYVVPDAADMPFRADLAASGVPVVVFSRTDPGELPPGWTWTGGVRLDAQSLAAAVPALAARHAYISGPPGLIADLAPALSRARGLTTDAFAGY